VHFRKEDEMRVLLLIAASVLVLSVSHSMARTLLPATDHSTNLQPDYGKKTLTPDQVFQSNRTGQVSVEFRVGAVSLSDTPFVMEEATNRPRVSIGEGKFSVSRLQVIVAEKAKARLRRLGIDDLPTHFYSKVVPLVSGKITPR
jgi:hypothetical protein